MPAQPDILSDTPCVEENLAAYYPLAYDYARYRNYAWRPGDLDDVVQCGMLGLLQAVRERAAKHLPPPDCGIAFARSIWSMWMPWWYSQRQSQEQDQDPSGQSFQPWHAPIFDGWEEYLGRSMLTRYLEEVEAVLGKTAARLARNLLDPEPAVIERAVAVSEEKRRRHEAGESVRGFNAVRVQQRYIREELELDESSWTDTIEGLRTFTNKWITGVVENTKKSLPDANDWTAQEVLLYWARQKQEEAACA